MSLVLLDVQMPRMDGFTVADAMASAPSTRDIPIIFITATEGTRLAAEQGYALGALDYITKPFDLVAMRLKVQSVLRLRGLADDAVRQSDERFEHLLDAIPEMVWTTDAETRLVRANQRWYSVTGADATTIEDFDRAVHPTDLDRLRPSRQLAQDTGEDQSVEVRLRQADDDYRWHLVRLQPTHSPDGGVTGWIGTATDVHDRRRVAGDRLLASIGAVLEGGMDFRQMLPSIAPLAVPVLGDWIAVGLLQCDGSMTWPSVASAVASPRIDEQFNEWFAMNHPEFMGLAEVAASGQSRFLPVVDAAVIDGWASDDDGRKLIEQMDFGSAIAVAIRGRSTTVGVLVAMVRGAERRYELEELQLAEELAHRLGSAVEMGMLLDMARTSANAALVLEFVGDGVFMIDVDDVIRVWNPAAERITGLAGEDVLGRKIIDAVPGWGAIRDQVPIAQAGDEGTPTAATMPIEVEGRELWLSISGVRFNGGAAFAFRDTTDLHRVESMQSGFVATVSHELRTPLAAISGACDTLLRTEIALSEETRGQLMEMISDQSNRLARIVNDILLASRLNSGQMTLHLHPCDARRIAEQVFAAARSRAPGNIDLLLDAPDVLPEVCADADLLYTVVNNLVDNAIKYSPDGGLVRVTLDPRVTRMRISVSDQGIGIPPGDADKVFLKFYRSDPGMLRGISGTGLGLYICHELVEQMDGSLWLDPDPGPGSTFRMELAMATSVVDALHAAGKRDRQGAVARADETRGRAARFVR